MSRVVITGVGTATPAGLTNQEFWRALTEKQSAIDTVSRFDASPFRCRLAAEVRGLDGDNFPERCQRVIGIDTFTDAAMYRRRPPEEIAARCTAFRADFPAAMTALVRMITLHDAEGQGVVEWIATAMSTRAPEMAVAVMEAMLRWDIDARWPLLPCPVATINSAPLVPLIQPIEGLAGLRLEMMEKVGHFPMLEDPSGFNARLRALLA